MAELQRTLGTRGLVVHYVSSVMGVGVLVLPGIAYGIAGPASLLAWLTLVAFSYPFALIFARMSMRYPNARGVIEFIEAAFGPRVASRTGVFLLITLIVANPLLAVAAARYLGEVLHITANRDVLLLGAGIMLGSIVLNLFGIRVNVRTQGILLTLLIIFIMSTCVVAFSTVAEIEQATPVFPNGLTALGMALIVCFFGFIGWENAAPVAEEVVDPDRTFPRAILVGVILVGAIYVTMAATVVLSLSMETGFASGATSFSYILQRIGGPEVGAAGSIVAAGLMMMTTNAWTLGTSRFLFGLSRSGDVPKGLAHVSGEAAVPRRALIALISLYGATIAGLYVVNGTELTIIELSSSGFLLFFLIGFVAAARTLERRRLRITAIAVGVVALFMLAINPTGLGFCAVAWLIAEGVRQAQSRRESPAVSS